MERNVPMVHPIPCRRSPTGMGRACGPWLLALVATCGLDPAFADEKELTLQVGELHLKGTLLLASPPGQPVSGLEPTQPASRLKPTQPVYGLEPTQPERGPVVLMVPGSGPTDRNGNQGAMANNSLKQVAEAFATAGIASLRIDKRGVGASSQVAEEQMRFDHYVDDAAHWMLELRRRGFSPVIALGHSEGSLVTGLAASRGGADAWISLCGAGEPIGQVLRQQLAAGGLTPFLLGEAQKILEQLERGERVEQPNPLLWSLFRPSVQPYLISWLSIDPAETAASLKIPLLAVAGETDLQVPPTDAAKLLRLRSDQKLVVIPGMNHVLKLAPADRAANFATYTQPDLPLAPGLMQALSDFVHRVVASIPPAPPEAPEIG